MKDITRGITNREQRALVRMAVRAGCEVTITGSNHVKIMTKNGPVYTGLTGSNRNAHRALRRQLEGKGVRL
jgi:NADP-dependent 3-hydroxy acid dehydrogenase YdfG